jgi:DSF synthase
VHQSLLFENDPPAFRNGPSASAPLTKQVNFPVTLVNFLLEEIFSDRRVQHGIVAVNYREKLHSSLAKRRAGPTDWLSQLRPDKAPPQLEFWNVDELALARQRYSVSPTSISFNIGLANSSCRELELSLDAAEETIWCFMRPEGPPSFTPRLLSELISVRRMLQRTFPDLHSGEDAPVKYFVGGSRLPGIYNLGGDLGFFIECIRNRDFEAVRNYAHDCVDVAYHMTVGFHVPLITIALVQGDALGGGLEGVLSFNVVVAEKSVKFGLPEILFNLFPGMGAFSFLSRKIGMARAQNMILGGRIYSATELHEMGLIDVLAEDGRGEDAVRAYIAENRHRHTVHRRIRDVNMRVNPTSLSELRDVSDIWAEHAMQLGRSDLRRMEHLMRAQLRRVHGGRQNVANS